MNAEEMIESVFCRTDRERLEQAASGDHEQLVRVERLRVAIDRLVDDGSVLRASARPGFAHRLFRRTEPAPPAHAA